MACLEQLQSDVRAIKNLLTNAIFCCDAVTYGPATVVEPPFVPGSGDPPATYGQTAITTWDDWTQYACYNANAYVDYLIQQAESFAAAAQNSSYTIGLVAAGLALLSFTGIGIPVAFAVASTALFALLQASSNIFDNVADDIETARDDIVCSIILGESLEDAVGTAIGTSSAAWMSLYQFIDYGSASSIIQQGGYGDEYLPAETDTSCSCVTTSGAYVNSGLSGVMMSIDGGAWQQVNGSHEILYGVSYRFQAPTGSQDCQITITDETQSYTHVSVVLNTNLPAGNGLLMSGRQLDGTWYEDGVIHYVPGGFPVTYSDCRYWRARQNVITYGSAYWVTAVFGPAS